MRFGVLGPLAVWTDDGKPVPIPEAKVRALLADLLTHEGRSAPPDRLVEDLWGERLPRNPTATLQTRVSQLRRALEDAEPGGRDLVVRQPSGYVLAVGPDAVDAGRFRALTDRARDTDVPRTRAALLTDALALWRGPAYSDYTDHEFARTVAARLDEERLTAIEAHAQARLDLGEHATLAGELADLVARHPLRERLRAVQLRALYQAGRQSEALTAYAQLRERLADELGVDPSPELAALHEAILRQDPALRATAPTPPPTNLPAALTPLVGRAEAVAEVRALLAAERLVTLTGPGGVGKTCLALEIARGPAEMFTDGVWSVELAGLDRTSTSPATVADLISSTLNIRDTTPGDPLDRLTGALSPRRLLLLLDNCEYVVEPVAAVAEVLLRSAPGLQILATSQEPLAIAGEWLWGVPPLHAPSPATTASDLRSFSAVELFVERAAAAAPGFRLGPDNADAVAEICRRLDGIPLALELAATRVRTLGVAELANRLHDRFAVLAAGRRGGPARQQTLRATIDWSWELLSPPERSVLRRLAVCAEGCTLAAAEEVAGPDDAADGTDFLDVLARLVDRSLVVAGEGPGGARYWLLDSVRAYGLDRLREAGELDLAQRRHMHVYTALAERAEPHLYGPGQRQWLETLDRERANLRTALETAVRLRDGDHAARLVNALAWYWYLRGRYTEAVRSLGLALEVSGDAQATAWHAGMAVLVNAGAGPTTAVPEKITDTGARARAQWFLAHAHRRFADLAVTSDLLATALDAFRAIGDRWGVAAALSVRASIRRARGALDDAERDALDSQALFAELGDAWGRLKATTTLAEIAEIRGDHADAEQLHRHGLRLAEELSLGEEMSLRLSGLGRIALLTGDLTTADAFHERAMRVAAGQANKVAEHFAEMGLALSARRQGRYEQVSAHLTRWLDLLRGTEGEPGLALVLAELGFAAEQRGDAEAALRLHREGLNSARTIGDPRAVALALEGLAGAHALAGEPNLAARLLGASTALRARTGAPLPPGERGDVDRITAALHQVLTEDTFTTEFHHGTHLDPNHFP